MPIYAYLLTVCSGGHQETRTFQRALASYKAHHALPSLGRFRIRPSAMKIPVDIHTHLLSQLPGEAIVNCYPETFSPQEGGWYSVGIHPWYIEHAAAGADSSLNEREARLRELLHHPQVLAVGEAGLDKLAEASMPLQLEVFERQAQLAADAAKPLVIHLVKAADELIRLKHGLKPANPWIIHGFRGKATLAQEYLRHGFYLSFGENYQAETLRSMPADRLFIETDESTLPIAELYARAAAVRGTSVDELLEAVQRNIRNVFF